MRFSDKLGNDAPGPGDYDPQDPQKRASGVVNFAADSIQRFAIDKENETRLGPGYYPSPAKNLGKRRRSSITSLFSQTPKRSEKPKPTMAFTPKNEVNEDALNELTERLRESQHAFEIESTRASEAEINIIATQLRCDEEIAKRSAIEDRLHTLEVERKEEREMYEKQLSESDEKIRRFEERSTVLENEKKEAQQQILMLSSQISELENAREELAQDKANVYERLTSLEVTLQESTQRETKLDVQVRETQELAEKRRLEIAELLPKLEALDLSRQEVSAQYQANLIRLSALEKELCAQSQQYDLLDAQVKQSEEESKVYREEIVTLRNHLSVSKTHQEQLNESLKAKEVMCAQTQETLQKTQKSLQEQQEVLLNLQAEYENRKQEVSEADVMCEQTQRELELAKQHIEEQRSLLAQTQQQLFALEQMSKEQLNTTTLTLEAETKKVTMLEAELKHKTNAYEDLINDRDLLQNDLTEKQQLVTDLETKITNSKIWLVTSQNLKEQLDQSLAAYSQLEANATAKEEQWNQTMNEYRTCIENLTKQVNKKNTTILEQKQLNDRLGENQRVSQQQKANLEQQVEVLQQHLKTSQDQLCNQTSEFHELQKTRNELSERVSTLLTHLSTAEAKISVLQTDLQAREGQMTTLSSEAKEMQTRLQEEVQTLTREMSRWKEKFMTFQNEMKEMNEKVYKAEAALIEEMNERRKENNVHTEDILELHAIIHNNQETREGLLAKLGSSEVQTQDLLLRIRVLELDANKHAKLFEEYQNNLSKEMNKSEKLVVELANREMEIESTKNDLDCSEKLVCDLRERLLKEQNMSSEFEAKYNYEVSNVAYELRASLSQQESVVRTQKEEIESLNNCLEKEKTNFLVAEHEWMAKENLYKHEISLRTNDVDAQNEKILNLQKEIEMSEYKVNISVYEREEQQKVVEKLTHSLQELETEKQTQYADFVAQLEAKNKDMQALEEKSRQLSSQNDVLTEEISALRRVNSIDKSGNERAVHAALANLELTRQELYSAHLVVEKQLAQIASQEKALLLAKEEACVFTQQLEKMTQKKDEAVKSYTSILKTLHDKTRECEEKELALITVEEEQRKDKKAFEAYKETMKSLAQENAELSEDCERLLKFVDTSKEAVAKDNALRLRMEELEASNRELEASHKTLLDSFCILDDEARESSSQTALLVGHNNQKQKIHIHAKVVEENRKLKHDNLRLSNSLLELKKASAQSLAVFNSENIAPTPVRKNVMATSISSINSKHSAEVGDDTSKSGPLQESFKTWQQKKKAMGTVEKRTPLAPIRGFSRQTLITPQKSIEFH